MKYQVWFYDQSGAVWRFFEFIDLHAAREFARSRRACSPALRQPYILQKEV